MVASRRSGTNSNYSLAWEKWVSWCSERKVDPFRNDVKWVLNFLEEMFKEGIAYRTLNTYRSAFHDKIGALNVGEHPEVCSLMSGIFNQRPPQPKYTFIWDVQVVVDFINRNWSKNQDLSDRQLSLKTAMLLALTSASRALGLHHLNLSFMGKT